MDTAFIKIGKKTTGHDEKLKRLGYEVSTEGDNYVIKHNGFVEQGEGEAFDATTEEKLLNIVRTVKEEGKLFTYGTNFKFTLANGEEKVLYGTFALNHLGEFSCLVAKASAGAAKKKGPSLDLLD